ncbi:MAG: asparagine synthetase B [Acidobacteriota bacterium]|jgi:asparagine synthase (glutamine-hydrolysing)
MCSIVGLTSKRGEDVAPDVVRMLRVTEHRGPDGAGVVLGAIQRKAESVVALDVSGIRSSTGLGHSRLQITGATGIQPLASCDGSLILALNGEIWDHEDWRERLWARGHEFETDSDAEVAIHFLEDRCRGGEPIGSAIEGLLRELNGEYAFAVLDVATDTAYLARDVVGVKQLYYGETDARVAFGSEKKPLWPLGITPQRVLPGQVVQLRGRTGGSGPSCHPLSRVTLPRPPSSGDVASESEALRIYEQALVSAIQRRLAGQPRVGVIFSGGVDSALIAGLAARYGQAVHCYAAGFPGSPDVLASQRVANVMGLPLSVAELDESLIEKELGRILAAIESADHLQADVAIPIYFAVERAAADGIRVLLTGQGADELFAGYPWYPDVLERSGPEALRAGLWSDIGHLYKDTLEREDKITMYHSIELRVPFLDPTVIHAAMSIPEGLKIRNGHVKYLHRRAAERLGVPDFVAWRPKEAAQHGSWVHPALKRILLRRGATPQGKRPAIEREKLGSAYRYGHDVYTGNEAVQQALDSLGLEVGVR